MSSLNFFVHFLIVLQLISFLYFYLFTSCYADKTKGTKLNKRGNDKNSVNKTSEESSSSTAGKSIKNMLLNMGKDSGKGLRRNKEKGKPIVLYCHVMCPQ